MGVVKAESDPGFLSELSNARPHDRRKASMILCAIEISLFDPMARLSNSAICLCGSSLTISSSGKIFQ